MKKITIVVIVTLILLIPLVYSFDDQLAQSCGGDDQLVIGCINLDDELFFIGNIPLLEEIIERIGHLGGTGLGTTKTLEAIRKKAEYPCPIDIPFFKRLLSTCKVKDNNICDDGEWFLMDKDCQLDNQLFFSMWFLRIILIITILLLAKNHKYFPVLAIVLVLLFFINGAFTSQSDSANEFLQNFMGKIPTISETLSCRGSDYLFNFGSCIAPDYPTLGWTLGLIIILFAYFTFKKLKSPGKETTPK